jgi:hypothetical protein
MGIPLETDERLILFIRDEDCVLLTLPLDAYEPGDIKEAREKLAEKFQCKPGEIEVRITGVKDRADKERSAKLRLVDGGTGKRRSKPTPG